MTDSTMTKMPDFQQTTLHGRIGHLEPITYEEKDYIKVVLIHTISKQTNVRVVFWNNNGLLTAFNNGNLVIGQELTISGSITGVRAFYMKDEELIPLKNTELQMRVNGYVFGSKPQPKSEAPFTGEPTLEEIPFWTLHSALP